MDKTWLVNICTRGWSLKALALMAAGCPARVSPLAAAAGCGRTAMGASVSQLVALGLLQRNAGHGHPLRPEYCLTSLGEAVASWALTLDGLVPQPEDNQMLRAKWALPVISTLNANARYSVVRKKLSPVSDRALSICFGRLAERQWIERIVCVESTPPAVSYHTLDLGELVHQHVQLLPSPVQSLSQPGK